MNPIAKSLIQMARFYNYEIEQRQLELYVDVLSQFPEALVIQACREYMLDLKNERFPIPPHKILKKHLPSMEVDDDSLARDAASRIVGAIKKYGWNNHAEARAFVGELGWVVVDRMGGWLEVCQNTMDEQIGTFQAQARDLCKAQLVLGKAGYTQPPALPENKNKKTGELEPSNFAKLISPRTEGTNGTERSES